MASVTTTNGTGKGSRSNGAVANHALSKGHGARPDKAFVGVCVVAIKEVLYLRVTLRPHHMKAIGNPDRIDIRGTTRDGLLIAPGKMCKASKAGPDLLYAVVKLSSFDARIPQEPRAQIWMRPEVKGGHIQLPGCPEAWIKAEGEYRREVYHATPPTFEHGNRTVRVSRNARDDVGVERRDAQRVEPPAPPAPPAPAPAPAAAPPASTQGVTAPMPRAVPVYQVPGDLREMESALAGKIGEVRAILTAMQDKTGMQFTLDRNLRVTVVLREK